MKRTDFYIIKDKNKYKSEEEYRLVATPAKLIYPHKRRIFNDNEMLRNDDALVREIVAYVKWAKKTVLCPNDVYIKLDNLKIVSIRVHPDMSQKTKQKFDDFCDKYYINLY